MNGHAALPPQGRPREEVLQALRAFAEGDPDYKSNRLWSLVYWLDDAHDEFLGQAWQSFQSANGLNPTAFQSLKRMETEIISVLAGLLHGPPETCGVVTSGGTESCLLAVKTYRDMALAQRGVKKPEMVLPVTAHVAWFKAAEYFGVRPRLLPLDASLRADVAQLPGLVNRQTVLVLGSAPEYPHGTIDPIEAMGAIAAARGVPMHVDACVGGFILPFMEMNGRALPAWDYRVPGVTSISADIHKYGFAAKGASTITYRSLELLRHQMFVYQDWPGGVFASPALLGTRPGGAYAAAWAAMQHFGEAGYRELAARTMQAFGAMRDGIAAIPELQVLGDPSGPLLAYGARDRAVNIFAVGDQLDAKGWTVNRLQQPDGLHAMVTAAHDGVVGAYLHDLREAVAVVKADPSLARSGSAATYGMMSHVPLRGMVKDKVLDLFLQMYRAGGQKLDLHAAPPAAGVVDAVAQKVAGWYVAWKQRRG
ncbi:aspartate aminotransferase family protein [Caenimonas sedimenti]|uniref:Aspartate aminotransferase family protein n=1 Tax=Caenimonas sedimenti TaxID=2596921 RepID=A0A562ZTV8_9BURK|nr:aspartate aminotransferase family protein [Caenimonas sedimenti]TWO71715.1 aspartate aminotransferase family protein [Caenimonas sedimenti]